ncbi:phage/plasmid primase, P4 family [Ignavibacterium sp.]|uniref:DNA primase family protein n=1 Tax=Ignavibacterium sp. TaxID=2651167 RepID=UPI0021FB243F|nr:phage/plasmid primase, P4 family [Ignavibacterium sp.]BDQ01934.1 MAG: hypothetical protein KatS3mg037_0509 [Ignavibacterium sp.]
MTQQLPATGTTSQLSVNHTRKFEISSACESFIDENPYTFYSTDRHSIVSYDPNIGCYVELDEEGFASIVQEFLVARNYNILSSSTVDNLCRFIRRNKRFRRDVKFNSNNYCFNVRNKMIDVTNGIITIKEHTPEFYSTVVYDVEYNPNAEAEIFSRVLSEVLPDNEKRDFILSWMAYLLLPTYEYQKILVLHGSGRNGKRTIFETIAAILGRRNVISVSTHEITKNRFMISNLRDKLLNLSSEQKLGVLEQDKLKQLSGEDLITADRKYDVDAVMFYNKARLIISANELPSLREFNKSVTERYQIVKFDKCFTDNEVDTSLTKKLVTEEEKSGLLNLLLEYYIPKILAKGSVYFDAPEIIKQETKLAFERLTDIDDFVKEACELGDTSFKTSVKELYKAYTEYCYDYNEIPLGKEKFTNRLTNIYNLKKQRGAHNNLFIYGIRLLN